MSTKTCKRCGWVYPITQPGTCCRVCGEPFEIVACRKCGKVVSGNQLKPHGLCDTCHSIRNVANATKSGKKRKAKLHQDFEDWVAKAKQVPKNYPTLTEEQWLDACRFFDGCARCYSDTIDTRGFFISRALGGRYCDWNIIPLCERCAKVWDLDRSVFNYTLKKGSQEGRHREYRESLLKIVEYLEVKLDNAVKYTGTTAESTEGSEQSDDMQLSGE